MMSSLTLCGRGQSKRRRPTLPSVYTLRVRCLTRSSHSLPILVTPVWQEAADDKRDLVRSQLLHRDLQRIRFAFEWDQHGCIHAVVGWVKKGSVRGQDTVSTVSRLTAGEGATAQNNLPSSPSPNSLTHSPDLKCSRPQYPGPLVLGHVRSRHSLLVLLSRASRWDFSRMYDPVGLAAFTVRIPVCRRGGARVSVQVTILVLTRGWGIGKRTSRSQQSARQEQQTVDARQAMTLLSSSLPRGAPASNSPYRPGRRS